MKVILKKDVQNLGGIGDVKDVADGYARNFLIPGGYAEIATEFSVKKAEEMKIQREKQAEDELKLAEEIAKKLEGVSVTIKAKADESGKLYAAIKQEEILEELKNRGFDIRKGKIAVKKAIKELGEHEAAVNLDHGLEARISVNVENEK